MRQIHGDGNPPQFDAAVQDYLIRREYPGNIRDLRHVVARLMYRYAGDGIVTIGAVPAEERLIAEPQGALWQDSEFERAIQRAVLFGAGLKEIGRAAEDAAIRIATEEEDGNLSRAARRLGVTDRALQLRRANRRPVDEVERPLTTGSLNGRFLDKVGSIGMGGEFVSAK